jgi:heme O synthase-like polyprenyltransferase
MKIIGIIISGIISLLCFAPFIGMVAAIPEDIGIVTILSVIFGFVLNLLFSIAIGYGFYNDFWEEHIK